MTKSAQGSDRASLTEVEAGGGQRVVTVELDNTQHLVDICGSHDRHLAMIEQALDVYVRAHGNRFFIEGRRQNGLHAKAVLQSLAQRCDQGLAIGDEDVAAALRMTKPPGKVKGVSDTGQEPQIRTKKRLITPRTPTQSQYISAMRQHDLVFGLGPAGTGKTYLAVAVGVSMMLDGVIDRLVLSRPAVEAGERLGFLPGDMKDKVDPYLRPLYDALHDVMPSEQVIKKLEYGDIEVAPLAFMRGRTLSNAFVILDEAQNCTHMQLKMFLTRLGNNARMVITGDPSQVDLGEIGTARAESGLPRAVSLLRDVEGVGVVQFKEADVVRHPLVERIVRAYNRESDV